MNNEASPNERLVPIYIDEKLVWVSTVASYLSYAALKQLLEEDV